MKFNLRRCGLLSLAFLSIAAVAPLKAEEPAGGLKELFTQRRYAEAVAEADRTLPGLSGPDRSKALLYKAYALEKLKRPEETAALLEALADDEAAFGRHRTEALAALARLAKAAKENPNPYYWRLLAVRKGHPQHRDAANRQLKAAMTAAPAARPPKDRTFFEDGRFVGLSTPAAAILFDRRTGQPAGLWGEDDRNLLDNAAVDLPLWELRFRQPDGRLLRCPAPEGKILKAAFNRAGDASELILTCETPEATVTVKAAIPAGAAHPELTIRVDNRTALQLWELDFPVLAFSPPAAAAACRVAYPWRKGREWTLDRFREVMLAEYPGSSARFQFIALYGEERGIYFQAADGGGFEKRFGMLYSPELERFIVRPTQFPSGRGTPGNGVDLPYRYRLGAYAGDWYDAARLYRAWWQQQSWAARGPLYHNAAVPAWLKQAPVWLRFYLRSGKKIGIEPNRKIALAWTEFLGGVPAPATLYHYSAFEEPPTRQAYPVSEYYGYNAPPFPGLPELLRELRAAGIRSNVYLQSEIYNQEHPLNAELVDSLRVGPDGKPRLYVKERFMACRQSRTWQRRFLGMVEHLLSMGFCGIYLDTYGKSKIDHECFDPRHGHPYGGGNLDVVGQRDLGIQVRELVKRHNPDFYIGGEACGEAYVDILDYKLNATNAYKDMLDIERVLYGDYFLAHGRLMRGADEANDSRLLLLDFLGGVIPGRYFSGPPKDADARQVLRNAIDYTAKAGEYMRTGEMLRKLPFAEAVPELELLDTTANQTIRQPALQNNVFRSHRDGSIGIAVINLGDAAAANALKLAKTAEWQLPPDAAVYAVAPDGGRTRLGALGELDRLPISLPAGGIRLFVVEKDGGRR